MTPTRITITLPNKGKVTALATGQTVTAQDGMLSVDLYPYQLISWLIK
jgi:hypothetical protein